MFNLFNFNLFIFFLIICQINFTLTTYSINCTFEEIKEEENFCGWKPDSDIWKTGNAVLVDSVNSVIHSSSGGDRFAYVQGHYGSPTEGKLKSPLISSDKKLLRFNYWKVSNTPSMDICFVKEEKNKLIEECIDSIQGLGQNEWILRIIELPKEEKNFKIVFKAKNLLSAEDIIGIDDIQLLPSEMTEERIINKNKNQNNKLIKKQRKSNKSEKEENTNQNYFNKKIQEEEKTNKNTNQNYLNQNIKIKHKQRKSSAIQNSESEEENTNKNTNQNNITRIIPYSEIIKNKKEEKKEEKINKNNTTLKHVRLAPLNGRNNKIFKDENKIDM
uniref:MAM domain-containing protein n=1 Tax=Meloidogyne hapla TaxID=6305 RepID=A0A1I8BXT5_MELHA